MTREQRAAIARETLEIIGSSSYRTADGTMIPLGNQLNAVHGGSRLYRPHEFDDLIAKAADLPAVETSRTTVSNRATLEAGRELAERFERIACLNFASAKNPGGGFLSGSQAQEESLARASGLYAALQTQPEFYSYHRRNPSGLYSDHVIFSPEIPVFRNDAGELLARPWQTAFITAAAVNAGAIAQNEPHRKVEIRTALERRARMVLAIAAVEQCDALILGAWGCGVFRNDPSEIAEVFAQAFEEPYLRDRFRHIEFAVLDGTKEGSVISPFRAHFG